MTTLRLAISLDYNGRICHLRPCAIQADVGKNFGQQDGGTYSKAIFRGIVIVIVLRAWGSNCQKTCAEVECVYAGMSGAGKTSPKAGRTKTSSGSYASVYAPSSLFN